jgi:hypothetical protein
MSASLDSSIQPTYFNRPAAPARDSKPERFAMVPARLAKDASLLMRIVAPFR